MNQRNYIRIADKYIDDVLSGKILACEWTKKACLRQKKDRERAKRGKWRYKWKPQFAVRVCQFIENMPHIEGRWAKEKQRLVLSPWQVFIVTTVFGWKWYRKDIKEWVRRFRTVYIELGRKNGKSTMSAPVGLYLMGHDGEVGAEVYSAATTREQAKEVWEPAWKMARGDADFREEFGIQTAAHSIYQELSGSKMIPVSAEAKSLDGLNGSSIIDELHAHRSREVFDVLETATGSRTQPLIWSITTAGSNRSGICYEQREYVTQILNKVIEDETYFGVIYTLDIGDDWLEEKNWIKPNPNLGVSLDIDELRRLAQKAKTMSSAQNNFLTKHMSMWVNASVNLFNIDKWIRNGNPKLKPEQFKDCPCWIGLDFAPRNDFTSRCLLFRREEEDGIHFYAFMKHFYSEGKIEESNNASLAGWAKDGWIVVNPGNQTDPDAVEKDIISIYTDGYKVKEFCADPSRTQGIEQHVEQETDAVVVEIPQLPSNMCPATEYLDGLIADEKIHHDGDPVMTWMLSNVIGRKKGVWGLYPDKEKMESKIDGVTALLTGMVRARITVEEPEKKYQVLFV